MRFPRFIAIAWLVLTGSLVPAHAEKRVALVVGNAAYRHADRLANPVNDARGMRDALTRLGFDVTYGEDLDLKALRQKIGQFAGRVDGADVAMVYFAGHGATFGDTPYVVPIDAEFSSLTEAPYEMVPVETLIGELRQAKGVRIAILDACRDNSAEQELKRQASRGGPVMRGLAPMKNPGGLIIAYATQYLSTAADDAGGGGSSAVRHSPFTAALLNNIATPGLDIKEVFYKAGREVNAVTGGRQQPEISVSMYDQYALVPAAAPPAAAVTAAIEAPPSASAPLSDAAQAWGAIQNTTSLAVLDDFIRQFGNVPIYGPLARARREELTKAPAKPADIAVTLQTGLVGHWPLDDTSTDWTSKTTRDVSGNGNTGTMVGMSPTTSPVPGKLAGALQFNGRNYILNSSNPTAISYGTAYSLAFWMKTASPNAGAGAIVDYSHTTALQFIGIAYDNGKLLFWNQDDAGKREILEAKVNLHDGNWHHVVGIRNETLYNIYVDGFNVAHRKNATLLGAITPNCLSIGFNCFQGGKYFYNGALDDVQIYKRALSEQEVAQLYSTRR